MPSIAIVLGKFVAKAVGPLGAPIEALIRWYDDTHKEASNQSIQDKLDDIFNELIKYQTIHDQIKNINSIIQKNGYLLKAFNKILELSEKDQEIELDSINFEEFDDHGVLSERTLQKELEYCFPFTDTLIVYLSQCNFKTNILHLTAPANLLYHEIIIELRRMALNDKKKVICYISRQAPGSIVLGKWCSLLTECWQFEQCNRGL